jgi:hypothetical protein
MTHRSPWVLAMPALAAALAAAPVRAGGTRDWELAGFDELSRGTLDGTTLSGRGEIGLGKAARRIDLEAVGLVWSAVRDKTGAIYVGTGYDGRIYRIEGRKAVLVANTKGLVVTALAFDGKGDLLAAALPEPVIYRIAEPSKIVAGKPVDAAKWVTLPDGTKHVWALALGADGRTLFAGTGPEGKIFAVGPDGKPNVYLDTEEEQIMCLAVDGARRLVAGTSPNALVLAVSGPGRSLALADFAGSEVKALAARGDEIIAAVNAFKIPPAIPSRPPALMPGQPTSIQPPSPPAQGRAGDGSLYALRTDGAVDKLWAREKAHVTSLAIGKDGTVFAGLGAEGKVVAVDKERVERTVLDLGERQVLAVLAGDDLSFAGTGDAGAAYAVESARAADASYVSPPLDAGAVSRWGALRWFGSGTLVVSSRSGNAAKPDAAWSDWSKPIAQGESPSSPQARYLQLRFSLADDAKASLSSSVLSYRPLNQRALVTDLGPGTLFPAGSKGTGEKDEDLLSKRTIAARPSAKTKTSLELTWKVDNPDGDGLRFRLWYRAAGESVWRPITREDEVVTKSPYTWSTESVPAGRYQIRLLADDSPDNDPAEALSDELVSVPVLVDNDPPRVLGLAMAGDRVRGSAEDAFSAISAIEFSVDGLPWRPASGKDGVLDAPREEFDFALPEKLAAGPHAIAVRAYDRLGNMGAAEIHVTAR